MLNLTIGEHDDDHRRRKNMKAKVFSSNDSKRKIIYSSCFFNDDTSITDTDMSQARDIERGVYVSPSAKVTAVMVEGLMVNLSKASAKWIEPTSLGIEYIKTGIYNGEQVTIPVKRLLELPHSLMEWQIEKGSNSVRRFAKFKTAMLNERIPGTEFYVLITPEQALQKDKIIRQRAKDVLSKLPLPIKKEWLDKIIDSLFVEKLSKSNENDPKNIYRVSLPSQAELENTIVSAYKAELWEKYHKRTPSLPSVRDGVFLIETFDLKKWMNFIKVFKMDNFKSYTEAHQRGIVSLVELVGPDAALKALKNYGPTIWHSIETKSFFKSKRELNLIPNRDIPKIESVLEEIDSQLKEDPENPILKQEKLQYEGKKAIMMSRLKKLNETSFQELEEGLISVLKVAYSKDDADHKNNSLLRAGIENIDRLVPHFKNKGYKFTRKNLKQALIELEYDNVRNTEVARVCSRAKVSQAEFEIYQNLWQENAQAREMAPVRIPTLSGSVGNLNWEMCDARDVNILTAGNETNCCQHPLGVGGGCITYMLQHPETSTIFRCTKKGSEKTVVQSFVWIDETRNILCFDNIEALAGISEKIIECYQEYSDQVQKLRPFAFNDITVGMGYIDIPTNELEIATGERKAQIPQDLSYSDASRQKLFTKVPNQNYYM